MKTPINHQAKSVSEALGIEPNTLELFKRISFSIAQKRSFSETIEAIEAVPDLSERERILLALNAGMQKRPNPINSVDKT